MKLTVYAFIAASILASCTRREPAQLEPGAARQQKDTSGTDGTALDKPATDNAGTQTQQDGTASTDKVENGVVSFTLTNGSKVSVRWDGQADKINSQYGIK